MWTPRIGTGTGATLTGVWGTAPNNVWVSVNANVILRWTGSWQRETLGIPAGAVFAGVSGTGPQEIYAHGGSLYRSTGDGLWARLDSPPIFVLWARAPDDLWLSDAVGNLYRSRDRAATWPRQAEEIPGRNFSGIWASGPDDVYVVSGEAIGHLRGGVWVTEMRVNTMVVAFTSVWGAGPGDVFVGASDGQVYRSRGDGRWQPERVDPARQMRIVGVWGTGPRNVYLATWGGIYHGR
jgi:hypothetical protein